MQEPSKVARLSIAVVMVAAMLVVLTAPIFAYPNARDCSGGNAVIQSPAPGATVFGIVQIEGTASLGGDFQYYKLEVAPTGTEAWGDLVGEARQQVVNSQLGVWDSAGVPDGSYSFRLRVVDPTGNYCETIVPNVTVQNAAPIAPTATEVVAAPTEQATEAPPVQVAVPTQAPTSAAGGTDTPGPSATPTRVIPTSTPDASSGGFGGIQFSTIVQAVDDLLASLFRILVFGVLTMAGIFLFVGVVYFVRRVL